MADIDANTAFLIAVIGAGSALMGGLISSWTNFLIEWQKDRKDRRKLFFDLKKEAYYKLIDDAIEYMNFRDLNPEKANLPDSPILLQLEKSYRKALLVGDKGSTIRMTWNSLDWGALDYKLIPALRDDLRSGDVPKNKHWWQFSCRDECDYPTQLQSPTKKQ